VESWQYRQWNCRQIRFPQRWLLQQQVPLVELQDMDIGKTRKILTPLTLPRRNNSVGRLVISVPFTTGTKKQVPKNPLFDTFTLLTVGASTWRRHSRASRAAKHLLQTASALVTKISKRCTLLDQQHPQRFAVASSQWGGSEISGEEEGGSRYSVAKWYSCYGTTSSCLGNSICWSICFRYLHINMGL